MDPTVIIDSFRRAAFGMDDWQDALRLLAQATQAEVVHLSGLGPEGALAFNLIHGVTPDMLDAFVRHGGFDARRNPRTGVGARGPLLRTVVDEDLMTERDRRALPIFGELFERAGAGRAAMARLDVTRVHGSITVMRPTSYAETGVRERQLLDAIVPALSDIVTQAVHLGSQQDRLTLATAEALDRPVLLLDAARHIVLMSPAVERWLAADGPLTLRAGEVRARDAACETAFAAAFARARDPRQPLSPGRKILLRSPVADDAGRRHRMVVTVSAMPHRSSGPLGRACVMVSGRMETLLSADLYAEMFGLTAAEAQIAVLLARGMEPAAIAALRNCSVLTVRTQIRGLYEKTETNRQATLVALLHALG